MHSLGDWKEYAVWEILTLDYSKGADEKRIHLVVGDICDFAEPVDLLVCSAFKRDYLPLPRTLIGALSIQKGISVETLAQNPELDMRDMGCWISKETGTCFSRIACVELLSLQERGDQTRATDKLLKSTFTTLRFLCEQADIREIPLRNMVMPVLGTGSQRIDINYVAPALLSQACQILTVVEQLKDIYIVERNPEKAMYFSKLLSSIHNQNAKKTPDVFISYSSKQEKRAHEIYRLLMATGVSCWIAPEDISPGSSYIEEISEGIGTTRLTILVLTPDAENSRWVQKEVGATIGAGHILIPYQEKPYEIGSKFRFLLDGEQIFEAWKQKGDPLKLLREHVIQKLTG